MSQQGKVTGAQNGLTNGKLQCLPLIAELLIANAKCYSEENAPTDDKNM